MRLPRKSRVVPILVVLLALSVSICGLNFGLAPARAESSAASLNLVPVGHIGGWFTAAVLTDNAAYLGYGRQVVGLDLSNLNQPVEVGRTPPLGMDVFDIVPFGPYAVTASTPVKLLNVATPGALSVAGAADFGAVQVVPNGAYLYARPSDNGRQILVAKVAVPAALNVVSRIELGANVVGISLVNGFLVAVVQNGPAAEVRVFSLADPLSPALVGQLTLGAAFDVKQVAANGRAVFVGGEYLLHVVEIGAPGQPFLSATLPLGSDALAAQGNYLYLTYQRFLRPVLRVVDVSNLHSPRIVNQVRTPGDVGLSCLHPSAKLLLACSETGPLFFDLLDPVHPRYVGAYQTVEAEFYYGMLGKSGRYAYVSANGDGIRVVDLGYPSRPQVGAYIRTGAFSMVIQGQYGYVGGWSEVKVFDLSAPATPVEVAKVALPVRTGYLQSTKVRLVAGKIAAVADDLTMIDITDPRKPNKLVDYALPAGCELRDFTGVGSMLYAQCADALHVIGLANPAQPTLVNSLTGEAWGGYQLLAQGGRLYVRDLLSHIQVLDIANPAVPARLGEVARVYSQNFDITVAAGRVRLYTVGFPTPPPVGPPKPTQPAPVEVYDITNPAAAQLLASVMLPGVTSAKLKVDGDWLYAAGNGLWAIKIAEGGAGAAGNVYLPLVKGAGQGRPGPDLSVERLHITQATQDEGGKVPLVAGRATVVRVLVRSTSGAAVRDIHLSLTGKRGGQPLPGSPLDVGPQAVLPVDPWTVDASFNVLLPAAWTSGTVELSAALDSTQAVAEPNEANNAASATVTFQAVPAVDIKLVPIWYTHTPTGKVYPPPTQELASEMIRSVYPFGQMSVSWRQPVSFAGDLKDHADWVRLLNVVTDVKAADGAPATQFYLALAPTESEADPSDTWCRGCFAAISWLGTRVTAVSHTVRTDDVASFVAGHELGHALGLGHYKPCTEGVDPLYPYPNVTIGQYGFDTLSYRVFPPDRAYDLMCGTTSYWISDYSYRKAFTNLLAGPGDAAAAGAGGMVQEWFWVDEDGGVVQMP